MITKIFVVYDSKVEAYLAPQFYRAKGEAIRAFEGAVNSKDTQFNTHPEDFTLFLIGEYDDATAKITTLLTPESIGKAIEFKKEIQ